MDPRFDPKRKKKNTDPKMPKPFLYGGIAGGVLLVVLVVWMFWPGGTNFKLNENDQHLKALSVCFGRYVSQHRGQGPPNEAEFRKFLKTLGNEELQSLGIDPNNLDALFVSPRDKQPYGIAWGQASTPPGPDGFVPLRAWEQSGVGGRRVVANGLGKIEEVDEATFNKLQAAAPPSKKR